MSWIAILTMLAMAAATALLVMASGWPYIDAVGTVVGVMFSLIAVLSGILYLLTPPTDRLRMWDLVINAQGPARIDQSSYRKAWAVDRRQIIESHGSFLSTRLLKGTGVSKSQVRRKKRGAGALQQGKEAKGGTEQR